MRWKLPDISQSRLFLGFKEKGLLWAVQGLACLAAAWCISQVCWWLAAPNSVTVPDKLSPALIEQKQRVIARHFFEVALAPTTTLDKENQRPSAALDTHWRLQGTYVGTPSRAILTAEGRFEVVIVKAGDHLSSGHTVEEVHPDSVVLSKDNQRSELVLRPATRDTHDQGSPDNRFGTVQPLSLIKDSR